MCDFQQSPAKLPLVFDIALIVFAAAVALVPIYAEISVGTLALKQQIKAVKAEVRDAVTTLSVRRMG